MKSQKTGVARIYQAFLYSYDGFCAAVRSEAAFRQELLFCITAGIFLFFLNRTPTQTALMAFSLIFILFAELINTAIESTVDRISDKKHPLSKKAKDIGSSLVLLSFVNMALIWGIILF